MHRHLWLAGLLAAGMGFPAYGQEISAKDLFAQLDANRDGKLEAAEIPDGQFRFFERVLRLGDRNQDGSLTVEELAFALEDRPDPAAPPTKSDSRAELGSPEKKAAKEPAKAIAGENPQSLAQILQQFDKDGDQHVSRDELPEGLKESLAPLFERLKTNKISLEMLRVMPLRKSSEPDQERVQVEGDWMGRDLRPGQGRDGSPEGARRPPFKLLRLLDTDQNGTLSKAEWEAAPRIFNELDLNQDGELGPFELLAPAGFDPAMAKRREMMGGEGPSFPDMLFRRADINGDGKVTPEEAPPRLRELFSRLDANEDGHLTVEELRSGLPRLRRDPPAGKN